MVLKTDIRSLDLKRLGKFDVILMDPPWEEYGRRVEGRDIRGSKINKEKLESWPFEDIMNLKLECLGDSPSFMFLWVGSENLERGRELFRKWGYKRCEDIVWIKTNKKT
jgi:mRNA (2'-O-methyladenosine-N6-)-methyltransferase